MPETSSESDTTCPNPHCQGGRVDTTPEGARHPAMQSDTECPVCCGGGEVQP